MEEQVITGIIILNYNNFEDTFNCIESIEKYNTAPIKIIIVDNGSTRLGVADKIVKFLNKRILYGDFLHLHDEDLSCIGPINLPLYTFIESKINDGYAAGNNKGLNLLNFDDSVKYTLILNNDILFVEDIIPVLVDFETTHIDAGLISPILYTKDLQDLDYTCARKNIEFYKDILGNLLIPFEKIIHYNRNYKNSTYMLKKGIVYPPILTIELPSGSCMLISKNKFRQIDFFDSNTFLYYEENILYKKTQGINLKNYLLTNIKCIHLGAQSTTKSSVEINHFSRKSKYYYYITYEKIGILKKMIYKLSLCWYDLFIKIWKMYNNEGISIY